MFLPTASIEAIVDAVREMRVGKNDLVLIYIAEKNAPDLHRLVEALNRIKVRFMGGIFAGVLYGNDSYSEGATLSLLPLLQGPFVITDVDSDNITLPVFGADIVNSRGSRCTAVIFVDVLVQGKTALLGELYRLLGDSMNYLGGVTGSFSMRQMPTVFTSEGAFEKAFVVCFADEASVLGVRHGWVTLAGPVVATRTRKNVISELNWQNAFAVYREFVEADCGQKLNRDNFLEIAMNYPFGIIQEGAEDVIRDPIALNERHEIVCGGEIPENTVLNIRKSGENSLIEAADAAAAECVALEGKHWSHCMVYDCASRRIALKDRFPEELKVVNHRIGSAAKHLTLEGVLSMGEIASRGEGGYLDFLNKTIVVGVLYRD